MTLTEFLLARFAEDGRGDWLTCPDCGASGARCESYKADGQKCCPDCHHPARVLDECEAKRRIVEHCDFDHLALSPGDPYVLQLLALPYANHPDYDPAWRP